MHCPEALLRRKKIIRMERMFLMVVRRLEKMTPKVLRIAMMRLRVQRMEKMTLKVRRMVQKTTRF